MIAMRLTLLRYCAMCCIMNWYVEVVNEALI